MKLLFSFVLLLFSATVLAVPVNVNKESAEKIAESLKGVGLKKAEAIVKYRQEHGAFKSADDLTHVSGIGAKTVETIKQDILLK
ncbi:MAG: helix-hairpin-helix domain-containing protein [Methylococcales bacterium]|nr:helix-hairpin-helix domain-containing protein [Methylococcales bacterium]